MLVFEAGGRFAVVAAAAAAASRCAPVLSSQLPSTPGFQQPFFTPAAAGDLQAAAEPQAGAADAGQAASGERSGQDHDGMHALGRRKRQLDGSAQRIGAVWPGEPE